MIQKKEENGEKYVTATTEAEFHEALNRGFAVELTRELAERIGVPMNEDVGAVAEIDAKARYDRHAFLAARGRPPTTDQARRCALAEAVEAGRVAKAHEL